MFYAGLPFKLLLIHHDVVGRCGIGIRWYIGAGAIGRRILHGRLLLPLVRSHKHGIPDAARERIYVVPGTLERAGFQPISTPARLE